MAQERNPRLKELPGIQYRTYGSKQGQDGFAVSDALGIRGSQVICETVELGEDSKEILPADEKRVYFRLQNIGSRLSYLSFGDKEAEAGTGFKIGSDDNIRFDETLLVRKAIHGASTGTNKITYVAIYA